MLIHCSVNIQIRKKLLEFYTAQFIVEIMSNQIGSNKINGKIFTLISGLVCMQK